MGDQQTFLKRIAAEPDADDLRLIFADWLEEQNKQLWANVIRAQIRATRNDPDAKHAHWPFLPPTANQRGNKSLDVDLLREQMGYPIDFNADDLHRGLVHQVRLSPEAFRRVGPALAEWGPMPALHLGAFQGRSLADCEALQAVQILDLTQEEHSEEELIDLLSSSHLTRLRDLRLEGKARPRPTPPPIQSRLTEFLASHETLSSLEHLALNAVRIGDEGVRALMEGQNLRGLRSLKLSECHFEGSAFEGETDQIWWPQLRMLQMSYNRLSASGAKSLLTSSQLSTVRWLTLWSSNITDPAFRAFGQSPWPTQVCELNLGMNSIGDSGFRSIAQSPALSNLSSLDVFNGPQQSEQDDSRIGPRGAAALQEASFRHRLRSLGFGGQQFGDALLEALVESDGYEQLEKLNATNSGIGSRGAQTLARSDRLKNLQRLNLASNHIGPEGATALAAWRHLPRLHSGHFVHNPMGPRAVDVLLRLATEAREPTGEIEIESMEIGDEGVERLVTGKHNLSSVRSLNLYRNGITEEGARQIAECVELTALTTLTLGVNPIGDKGINFLAYSEALSGLTQLSLRDCSLTDRGVTCLAQSPRLKQIRHLALDANRITDKSVDVLIAADWPELEELILSRSGLSGESLERLVQHFEGRVIFYGPA